MAKGGNFEREFCKALSLWWSKGDSDSVFWRTSNSGGRATVRHRGNKKTKGQHGDVCATEPEGKPLIDAITIELKRGYSRSTIADLLDRPLSAAAQTYEAWIEKARRSKEAAGTPYWLLVARRDRREAVAFMPWGLFNALRGLVLVTSIINGTGPRPLLALDMPDGKLVGMPLNVFFAWVDPALIPKLIAYPEKKMVPA